MTTRYLDTLWLALIVATVITWWLGESGASGPLTVAFILGIAALKGLFIALDFMSLRGVRRLWPGVVTGWLLLCLGLIALAYRAGLA